MSCLTSLSMPAVHTKHLKYIPIVEAFFQKSLGLFEKWPFNELKGLILLLLKVLFAWAGTGSAPRYFPPWGSTSRVLYSVSFCRKVSMMEQWSFCLEIRWMLCKERPEMCPKWRGKGWRRCDSVLCCLTYSAASLQLWGGQPAGRKPFWELFPIMVPSLSPSLISLMQTCTEVLLVPGRMRSWPARGR